MLWGSDWVVGLPDRLSCGAYSAVNASYLDLSPCFLMIAWVAIAIAVITEQRGWDRYAIYLQ